MSGTSQLQFFLARVDQARAEAEAAEDLREQAASCRRLARRARTNAGTRALTTLAEHLDTDARRIDPNSLRK